ncbi:PREDICTED: transmembrane emp24 domain-containing protein 1-like [Tinamus guttatus]|uniref:transmembrane emp24 domain-containing protein 1-like n=1 Tax=Tinamus guttatus TaxID=94827 RepID=UPI00052E9105|nr:PREDICTED: transmembrane emp24 domain-containing protein 1-like [Tinamus guttatus]
MSPRCPRARSVEPTEAGDYRLCFDNSFSAVSEKLVFFELLLDGAHGDEDGDGDAWLDVEPTEAGDYRLCFDNSFSAVSEKLVFFELLLDGAHGDEDGDGDAWLEAAEPEDALDVKIQDIKESIETMRSRLERSIQMQALLRAFEARDRKLQESNRGRVDFWSAVNLGALLLVALLQVYTLRSLFQEPRRLRT